MVTLEGWVDKVRKEFTRQLASESRTHLGPLCRSWTCTAPAIHPKDRLLHSSILQASLDPALAMRKFVYVTNIKKKKASSNEFWNRMMWMSKSMIFGLWNQKWSSEGWTTMSPSTATCFSATSWANWFITCSSFVPTASNSCEEAQAMIFLFPRTVWLEVQREESLEPTKAGMRAM